MVIALFIVSVAERSKRMNQTRFAMSLFIIYMMRVGLIKEHFLFVTVSLIIVWGLMFIRLHEDTVRTLILVFAGTMILAVAYVVATAFGLPGESVLKEIIVSLVFLNIAAIVVVAMDSKLREPKLKYEGVGAIIERERRKQSEAFVQLIDLLNDTKNED